MKDSNFALLLKRSMSENVIVSVYPNIDTRVVFWGLTQNTTFSY